MINLRYHIVSLAAMFLALAAGIALGAGPLQSRVDDRLDSRSAVVASPGAARDVAVLDAFHGAFAKAVGPGLVGKRLDRTSVAIFTLPGADRSVVDALTADLKAAGAGVTTSVALTAKLLDPSGRQFTQGVAQQSLDGVAGVRAQGQSNFQLAGTAIARAFLAPAGNPAFDSGSATVASAFREAGLVSTSTTPTTRANLALVVAGAPSDAVLDGQDELVATLAAALDAGARGTVLAGPVGSARGAGFVKAVRDRDAARTVSTVDVADVPAGQVVTVLALQRESTGTAGAYGAVDAPDGAMPSVRR